MKEGHAGSVMCSYNRLNGPHACESTWLLDQILRAAGVSAASFSPTTAPPSGSAAGCAPASTSSPSRSSTSTAARTTRPAAVQAALAAHRTRQALVDRAVRHVLRTLFAYGFFDRAGYADDDSRVDRTGHAQEARRLAEAGTVLLKNDSALPLDSARLDSLAVIGADGDAYKNGGGSSNVEPYSLVTPRAGIATRAGSGVDVRYDPGDDPARPRRWHAGPTPPWSSWRTPPGRAPTSPASRSTAAPPAGLKRDELIERVAAANKRTIVVLETAGPVLTPWRGQVEGIVEAWYPGSGGGAAIARVLFGDVDPGGRLPATFPRREARPAHGRQPAALPGRRQRRPLLRGRARRLPLVRPARHRAGLPVRPRPLLHALRLPQPARAATRRRGAGAPSTWSTSVGAPASRCRSSTSASPARAAASSRRASSRASSRCRCGGGGAHACASTSTRARSRTGAPTATAGRSRRAATACWSAGPRERSSPTRRSQCAAAAARANFDAPRRHGLLASGRPRPGLPPVWRSRGGGSPSRRAGSAPRPSGCPFERRCPCRERHSRRG